MLNPQKEVRKVVDLVPVDPDKLVVTNAYSQVFGEGKLTLTCWFYGTQGEGDLKQYLFTNADGETFALNLEQVQKSIFHVTA